MLFEIVHRTEFRYGQQAREAYIEARLTPPSLPGQVLVAHNIEFAPATPVSTYHDYFGNEVTFYSHTLRHERLTITNTLTVRTIAIPRPAEALEVPIAEVRQLFSARLTDIFDYLQPTPAVPTGNTSMEWARRYFPGDAPLGEALAALNRAIHEKFRYEPGSTDNSTPLATVWKQRAGVCQDFAHVMISGMRGLGLPACYVSGYIRTTPPEGAPRLEGADASHAWVGVWCGPEFGWLGLDPTNDLVVADDHIVLAFGRDYADVSPTSGVFVGSGHHDLSVSVDVRAHED